MFPGRFLVVAATLNLIGGLEMARFGLRQCNPGLKLETHDVRQLWQPLQP